MTQEQATPEDAGQASSQIHVTLEDAARGRRLRLRLPDQIPLAPIIPVLAGKLGLPEGAYALAVEGRDAPLAGDATLAEAGVGEGATLRLVQLVPQGSEAEAEPRPRPPAAPRGAEPVVAAKRVPSASGKRRCSALTAAGEPCHAWAVRGSDPPLCAAHGGMGGSIARARITQSKEPLPAERSSVYTPWDKWGGTVFSLALAGLGIWAAVAVIRGWISSTVSVLGGLAGLVFGLFLVFGGLWLAVQCLGEQT